MLKNTDNFFINETVNDVTLPFIRHTVDTSESILLFHSVKWRLIDILQMRYDNNYIFAMVMLEDDKHKS